MKKLGLIGGLGPEATVLYYQGIIGAFKDGFENNGYPELVIESVDLRRFMAMTEDWNRVAQSLAERVNALHRSGADVGAICSNTPHIVFDVIQNMTDLPLISIVETASEAARLKNLKRPLLLGTQSTMSSDFYRKVFEQQQIEVIVPSRRDQAWIHRKIFSEIEYGIILDETRQGFLNIIAGIQEGDQIDSVILGCTELPLILDQSHTDLPVLDTTEIHIQALVKAIQ